MNNKQALEEKKSPRIWKISELGCLLKFTINDINLAVCCDRRFGFPSVENEKVDEKYFLCYIVGYNYVEVTQAFTEGYSPTYTHNTKTSYEKINEKDIESLCNIVKILNMAKEGY